MVFLSLYIQIDFVAYYISSCSHVWSLVFVLFSVWSPPSCVIVANQRARPLHSSTNRLVSRWRHVCYQRIRERLKPNSLYSLVCVVVKGIPPPFQIRYTQFLQCWKLTITIPLTPDFFFLVLNFQLYHWVTFSGISDWWIVKSLFSSCGLSWIILTVNKVIVTVNESLLEIMSTFCNSGDW